MKNIICGLVACGTALCLGGVLAAQQGPPAASPKPDTAEATAHVNAARTAAGNQWREAADFFCHATPNRANSPSDPLLEPTRIFDNLYVIGRVGTAVFVVPTSDGLVMIDSGYADQLESVLLPGLAALRLDPANIKYNIIGHGHGDHFGGASYFQEKYRTRVVMGAADWNALENPPQGRGGPPPAGAPGAPVAGAGQPAPPPAPIKPPKRDIAANDGQVITVGDTRFTIVGTPGHTPGSIGVIFQVKDGSTTHTAGLFGGTILIPGRVPDAALQDYVRSLAHFGDVAKRMNVDVEIQNHPLYDRIQERMAAVRTGKKGAEHPFVVGADAYQKFVTVMSECVQAQMARRAAAAQ